MTEKQKHQAEAITVAVVLLLVILWALWEMFRSPAAQAGGGQGEQLPGVDTIPAAGDNPYSINLNSPDGCGCGCGSGGGGNCPISPGAIQSINQMYSLGQQYAATIDAAGNATLQAIADIANENDPLLRVTVG